MPPNNSPVDSNTPLTNFSNPQPIVPTPPPQPVAPSTDNVASPIFIKTQPSSHKGRNILLSIVLLIIILLIAVASYAFYEKMWFFGKPPYDTEKLALSIFSGIGNIKTASHSLSIDVVSEPRDIDAVPFKMAVPVDAKKVQAYKRDLDKARDIQNILNSLMSYGNKQKYPINLSLLNIANLAPNADYNYIAINNGGDFTLTTTFETSDAVDSIKNMKNRAGNSEAVINNKTVTFSKASSNYFYLPSEPKQPAIVDILNMQNNLSIIPTNFKLNVTISGATEKIDEKTINTQIHLAGNADLGDINVAVDLESKKIADNFYIFVSKFPSFFFDISKLKDKWIKITPSDLDTFLGGMFKLSTPNNSNKDEATKVKEEVSESIRQFLTIADKNHALVSTGEPVSEVVNGTETYRYDLEFNKDTLVDFYTNLTSEFKNKLTDKNIITFDQATLDYLKSPEFDQTFEYFRKNTSFTIWADKDGIPAQAKYSVRIVPDTKGAGSDRQILLTITLALSDINQTIKIEEPLDSMSAEDATIAMSGETKEQYRFGKQINAVESLRNGINLYKQLTGSYPNKLDELKVTRGDLKKKFGDIKPVAGSYVPYGSDESSVMNNIPLDVFTNQPFGYTNQGSDYIITYTIELPKYEAGTYPKGVHKFDYTTTGTKIVFVAVSGKNTANSKVTSKEAAAVSEIDTDKDKLPDILERYIGTDISKSDTDGDGYSDNEELSRGTDPLGAGNLSGSKYGY